jgi:hypothetical protein
MSPDDPRERPNWQPVDEPRLVFRFLKNPDPDAENFVENFASDDERGKEPTQDEHPDWLTGMSVFVSEEKARQRWSELRSAALRKRSERNARRQRPLRMSVGDHIGEVLIAPNHGFEIVDDDDPEGHMTLRGDKHLLASSVANIYPAQTEST